MTKTIRPFNKIFFSLFLILLAGLPAGCGYHFPGALFSQESWENTILKVTGQGATDDPRLAHILREKLIQRLGFSRKSTASPQQATLFIRLSPTKRSLLLEDRSGRADQYRVIIEAQPQVAGRKEAPKYPLVKGIASYYEPRSGASIQATRNRAENEALDELIDSLSAVLTWGV